MAHCIVYKGKEYPLSVAELDGCKLSIYPYTAEIPATRFINGRIRVEIAGGRLKISKA